MFQIAHLFVDISILSDLPPRSLVQVSARRAAFGANQPEEQLIRLLALQQTHRGRENRFSRRLGCRRQRQVQLTTIGPNHRESQRAHVSWVFSGAPGVRRVGSSTWQTRPVSETKSSLYAPSPDTLTPAKDFSSSAHIMVARASVTPLISICPRRLGRTLVARRRVRISRQRHPIGCLALFRTAQRALVWVSARPQSMVQARAAQPCPSASYQLPLRFVWESHHHAPHSLCCAPIGCLSRFSANAAVFDGPGKPFRARSTWRPSVVVSSYHQIRSAPSGRPGSGSHQRCHCQRAHPRDGAQASTRRTQIFQTTVYRHSSSCPQLETILIATWKGHSALSGIRLVGQNCYRRKMVFHQSRLDLHR